MSQKSLLVCKKIIPYGEIPTMSVTPSNPALDNLYLIMKLNFFARVLNNFVSAPPNPGNHTACENIREIFLFYNNCLTHQNLVQVHRFQSSESCFLVRYISDHISCPGGKD